jgi:DNA-binding CsgD family transcriptional regulator
MEHRLSPRSPNQLPPERRRGQLVFSKEGWALVLHSLRLSNREAQIVRLFFDDIKESAIASVLGISRHTVHTHVERLYRKLGVTSHSALVIRVVSEYLALSEFVAARRDGPVG